MSEQLNLMTEEESRAFAIRHDFDPDEVLKWRNLIERALAGDLEALPSQFHFWQRQLMRLPAENADGWGHAFQQKLSEWGSEDDPVIPRRTRTGRLTEVRTFADAKESREVYSTKKGYNWCEHRQRHTFEGIRSELRAMIDVQLPSAIGIEGATNIETLRAELGHALKDGFRSFRESMEERCDPSKEQLDEITATARRAAYLLDELADLESDLRESSGETWDFENLEWTLCHAIRLGELLERTRALEFEGATNAKLRSLKKIDDRNKIKELEVPERRRKVKARAVELEAEGYCKESARVAKLAEEFDVSASTIRTDIRSLR